MPAFIPQLGPHPVTLLTVAAAIGLLAALLVTHTMTD